jgi:hypothetical protein
MIRRVLPWVAIACVACVAGACDGPTSLDANSFLVTIRSGDHQHGLATGILDEPLQVAVTDPETTPVRGVVVVFRVTEAPQGGAATPAVLGDSISVTGVDGVARASVRLGAATGDYTVEARLKLAPTRSVIFRVTATLGAALATVAPSTARAGDTVEVRGARFGTGATGNAVLFGTIPGRITSSSGDTLLRAVVPACLPSGGVQVRVSVGTASTNAVSMTYVGSSPTVQLAIGEALTVSGTELESCLRLPGNGPRYLIVPQFAAGGTDATSIQFSVARGAVALTPSGAESVFSGARAGHAAFGAVGGVAGAVAGADPWPRTRQLQLDDAMRQLERAIAPAVAAEARARRAAGHATARLQAVVPAPALNSTRGFQVLSNLSSLAFKSVTAALRYAGASVLVYVDQTSATALGDADLKRLGDLFDKRLYPIDVQTFGGESDLDGNGRVIVLLTPVVNSLVSATECFSTGAIAGLFYPNDLYVGNQGSNKGEIFYTLVPDPTGVYSCTHSVKNVLDAIPGTFIHEMQHMISFNEHVVARGGESENVWLNEGLSLIAEELGGRYYEDRFPAPSGRTNPGSVLPDSAYIFEGAVLADAYRYLIASQQTSVTVFKQFGSLSERGAAWLFLRWLADHKGDQILAQLVQTGSTSVRNVEEKSGETFDALFGDFSIAVIADIPGFARGLLADRQRFLSRDFSRLFPETASRNGFSASIPVLLTQLTTGTPPVNGSMPFGTMAFYSLATANFASGVTVRFSQAGGLPFAPNFVAQVGIVRVQ